MNLSPFQLNMSRNERILGRIYLPVHMFAIPVLITLYVSLVNPAADMAFLNLAYYVIGFFLVLAFMRGFLRRDFDVLCDRLLRCVIALCSAYCVDILLSMFISLFTESLFSGMLDTMTTPNDQTVLALATGNYGYTKAISVFLAPMVEEVLFRGVIFGGIREKNRAFAYVASIFMFGLYHVWQYVIIYADPTMLLYIVMYIPVSTALAWCYDRTGTIWAPIFFHMLLNSLSLHLMTTM